MSTVNVISVVGAGRSGTTLLDRVLGTLDGVESFNEIHALWQGGFIDNNICACGSRFSECEFWNPVSSRLLAETGLTVEEIFKLHDSVDHTRHFLKIYSGIASEDFKNQLTAYKDVLTVLYDAIASEAGNAVIVDSSKVPSRPLILSQLPNVNVHIVHLVRDVRGVVYSWSRDNFDPAKGRLMKKYPMGRVVRFWAARNLLAEMLGRKLPYIKVRYEDFTNNPKDTIQNIIDTFEPLAGKVAPFVDQSRIELGGLHSMSGNPIRFSSGLTEINPDRKWLSMLDRAAQKKAALMALPLLARYGYLTKA